MGVGRREQEGKNAIRIEHRGPCNQAGFVRQRADNRDGWKDDDLRSTSGWLHCDEDVGGAGIRLGHSGDVCAHEAASQCSRSNRAPTTDDMVERPPGVAMDQLADGCTATTWVDQIRALG